MAKTETAMVEGRLKCPQTAINAQNKKQKQLIVRDLVLILWQKNHKEIFCNTIKNKAKNSKQKIWWPRRVTHAN